MGENAGWPIELADVRSNAARFKCGHHSGERFRRARRRLFSHLRVQQSRECGRGGAAFAEAVAAPALPAAPEPLAKAGGSVVRTATERRGYRPNRPLSMRTRRVTLPLWERSQRGRIKTKSSAALSLLFFDAGRRAPSAGGFPGDIA